jgi:SAM-dependent methyltransferase
MTRTLTARARSAVGFVRELLDSTKLRFEERSATSPEILWQRSRERWRRTQPSANLTWGKQLSGDRFVMAAAQWNAFGPERSILEIGPGYGRLLDSCLRLGLEFNSYLAVDISPSNVEWLKQQFRQPKTAFVVGDIESIVLESNIDVVLSSLTFKHLFPTFEKPIRNIAGFVKPGGLFVFDLREGTTRFFESADNVTYIRCYTKPEVRNILDRAGIELLSFDQVEHDPLHRRLLVVARKPMTPSPT